MVFHRIAFVNQEGVNRDAAATLAAGVAAAFIPGITVDGVLEALTEHSSYLVRRAIDLTVDLAHASETVDEFAQAFYVKMLDWTWPTLNYVEEGSCLYLADGSIHLLESFIERSPQVQPLLL